jgi:hypothetical protein
MTTDKKKSAYNRMADKLDRIGLAAPAVSGARDIETITDEILDLKKTAGEALLEIGARLIEAKSLLSHGEWLTWLSEKVEFSERSANRFMKLAREWTNPTTLADLGASRALALLALPEPERNEFMEEVPVEDMSVRELEKAIRERDEARKSQEKMADDLKLANNLLEQAGLERDEASARIAELERQLKELREKPVDVAVMAADQEALDAARAEAVEEMQAKVDQARRELSAANSRIAVLEDQAKLASDPELAEFKVLFNQTQENTNKMAGLRIRLQGREDPSAAQSVRRAMLALSDKIRRDAE